MLIDQHQRRFTYLRLSITDVCNFRCSYCLPDGYSADSPPDPMSLEEIKAVVAAFAANGTRKVRITGGEPTLRKDLTDIIRACKNTDGITTVAMTSNGYRMSQQIEAYIDAGLDTLNLSADSLRPETFRLITGHDKLDEIMATIDLAAKRGMKQIKVNAVLLKQYNLTELNQFFEFVKSRPITLRFIELMQTGDNAKFFKQQHVSGVEVQKVLLAHGWQKIDREAHSGPAVEYSHPDSEGNIGLIMPYSKDFCHSCNRLRVSSDGHMHLCLFADNNLSLRPYLLTDTTEELAARIQKMVLGKGATHHLHDGESGITKHLAMLGG